MKIDVNQLFQRSLDVLNSYQSCEGFEKLKNVMQQKAVNTSSTTRMQKYLIVLQVINLDSAQFEDIIKFTKEEKDKLYDLCNAFMNNEIDRKEFIQQALTIIVPDPS